VDKAKLVTSTATHLARTLIISPVADRPSLQRMGIEVKGISNVGGFTEGQKTFLDFHRNSVLLMRRQSEGHV
jgi:hypothetical protein